MNCTKRNRYHDPKIDHIIPVCLGGKTVLSNGQALCLMCHRVKTKFYNSPQLKGQINL